MADVKTVWSRRTVLEAAGFAAGAAVLRTVLWPSRADAAVNPGYLVFCYFSGGWDQLLALDPRDQTLPQFAQEAAYARGGSGIFPAYGRIQDAAVRAVLVDNPSGVRVPQLTTSSPLTFGPAVPDSLLAHAQDLAIVRGVAMGTLTHEVGRRYFITGKFPRGLQASGSSLPTAMTAQVGDGAPIPNLTVGVESYNETMPAWATGLEAGSASDVQNVLRPLGTTLTAGNAAALAAHEALAHSCAAETHNGSGLADLFRASREKARSLVASGAANHFNFTTDPTRQSDDIRALFAHFGIVSGTDVAGAKGQAALAAQALTKGISRAVSVQLANGIDDHDDEWERTHATALRNGFDALGRLIAWLKNAPDPAGGSVWERTTLVCFSEFARTPLVNTRRGRDHHLASSCLLAGPGIRGNVVVGATSDQAMATVPIDFATGAPGGDAAPRPADLHATILDSMGMTYAHISNQDPRVIGALRKA